MKKCDRCGVEKLSGILHSKKLKKDLCYDCYHYLINIDSRKKRLKNHKCLNCGVQIEPVRCPHCKKPLKYKIRCDKCQKKSNIKRQNERKER